MTQEPFFMYKIIQERNWKKELNQEPLRTLAKDFQTNSKVYFGIYLRPIKTGKIYTNDEVKVISKHI